MRYLIAFLLLILAASAAQAQQHPILCDKNNNVSCTTTAPTTSIGSWDPSWLAYGKINTDIAQLFPSFTGLSKGNSGSAYTQAGAADVAGALNITGLLALTPTSAAPAGAADVAATVNGLLQPQTAAELAADVVPTNLGWPAGDIRRYDTSGGADYAAAITAAYQQAAKGGVAITIATGTWTYKSPLVLGAAGDHPVSWQGAGSGATFLVYAGANTATDAITIGNGSNSVVGQSIVGINFESSTVMTSGAGVHFVGLVRSTLKDVHFGDQDYRQNVGNNWFHGVWFDGFDFVTIVQYQATAQQDAIRANGNSLGEADFYASHGKVSGSGIGMHFGGGAGGVWIDSTDIITNAVNMQIDEGIIASPNREFVLGPGVALDSAGTSASPHSGTDLIVNDSNSPFIFLADTWIATAATLINIEAIGGGFLKMTGGFLYHTSAGTGTGDAIAVGQTDAQVQISGTRIQSLKSTGTAVDCTAATTPCTNVSITAPVYDGSGMGLSNSVQALIQLVPSRLAINGQANDSTFNTAHGVSASTTFLSSTFNSANVDYFGADANSGFLELGKSRGTIAGAHGLVQSGDTYGQMIFSGDTGSGMAEAARIYTFADGTPRSSSMPGKMCLRTTPAGSISGTDRLCIGNAGNATLAAPGSGVALAVSAASGAAAITATGVSGQPAITATQPVKLPAFTIAGLPTCNSTLAQSIAVVTDSNGVPTYGNPPTSGGTTQALVMCNGGAWVAY